MAGRKVATVDDAGQGGEIVVAQIGAVVGRRRPHLDGQLDPGPGSELVGVHPQAEARAGGPASSTARDWSTSNAPRSQNTSIHRAAGASAGTISSHTWAT